VCIPGYGFLRYWDRCYMRRAYKIFMEPPFVSRYCGINERPLNRFPGKLPEAIARIVLVSALARSSLGRGATNYCEANRGRVRRPLAWANLWPVQERYVHGRHESAGWRIRGEGRKIYTICS
jgi:RNA recognition motif-containing protein